MYLVPFLLLFLCVTAQVFTSSFCPAHLTTTVRLADGTYSSVLAPCKPSSPSFVLQHQDIVPDPKLVIPEHAGNMHTNSVLSWSGRCFHNNTARLVVDASGYTMSFELGEPASLACVEAVLLPTTHRFNFHVFATRGNHVLSVNGFGEANERAELLAGGVPLFYFPERSVRDGVPLR